MSTEIKEADFTQLVNVKRQNQVTLKAPLADNEQELILNCYWFHTILQSLLIIMFAEQPWFLRERRCGILVVVM